MQIEGILFDKDGTLFDFGATWNGWARRVIDDLSGGDPVLATSLARASSYDLGNGVFHPDSPVIAGTNREAAECLASALNGWTIDAVETRLTEHAAQIAPMPAVPLAEFLGQLRIRGLKLGVMTNDTEYAARAHLESVSATDQFDFIAGFDSGYGAKPDPAPLLAFADAVGIAAANTAMVGDSTHDLIAGRAAGMQTIGVLTGLADQETLAPFADHVFPNIGYITGWLDDR